MTRHLLLLSALLALAGGLRGQDPIFTQFYAAPLTLSPAFAGNTYAPRIALNYRNQWPAVVDGTTAFATYAASYEQFLAPLNSGIGVLVKADDAGGGMYKINKFAVAYAYRIAVNEEFNLKIGLEAGGRQVSVDWDRLIFPDQLDPKNGPVIPTNELRPEVTNKTYFDVGAGLLAYGSTFYGGVSLKHLTTPDESLLDGNPILNEGLALRLSVHAGAQFALPHSPYSRGRWGGAFVSPNVLYIKQADQGQLNAGAYVSWGQLFFGAWYRHAFTNPDAVIGLIGYQWEVFKVGYSYDFTVSELAGAPSGGSHELSLVINLDNSEKVRRRRQQERYNDCFKLFR
ncbi:MAG: type IX secretion system membrane protein PorP/SprF [Bacteroidetes bacterium]|nr:MAG: type IX secretion system membrane protein PorP/SprF [Bacteroidota bacterium]